MALGGGLELALACDFRIVARGARLGQPEVLLGIIPGGGGTQRLARLIGPARAKDLVFTGRHLSAEEAFDWGLVDRVVEADVLASHALDFAHRLASGAVVAQSLAKRAIDVGLGLTLAEGLALERELIAQAFETRDAEIGLRSFLEKGPVRRSSSAGRPQPELCDDLRMTVRYIPQAAQWPVRVDLRSDTVTKPTAAMRQAMSDAPLGDEQLGEDPSVNELVETVAQLLGKQAAVFLPSGTMCNEIALALHCRPGDEFYCDRTAHPLHAEAGGSAALAGAQAHVIDGERGIYSAQQLEDAISPLSRYSPRPRLAWVEQTANLAGGTIWRPDDIKSVVEVSKAHGLATHLDGARLFNATVVTGELPSSMVAPFDSVWVDFSKGLGAPVGAVLAGSEDFIDEAWRWKQRLGGSMRQAGVLAAAASFALVHHVDRLAEDHALARRLADGLAEVPGIELDPARVETNIVIFGVDRRGGADRFLTDLLSEHGVRGSGVGPSRARFVTHLDLDGNDIETAIAAVHATMTRA